MATITTAFTTAGKLAFLKGELLAAHTYKMGLFRKNADLGRSYGATTSVYGDITAATSDEVSGTGYSAGGYTLLTYAASSGSGEAWIDWSGTDPNWTAATFTAAGAFIYDDTDTVGPDRVLAVFDFGGDKPVVSGTFTVNLPAAAAGTAVIRLT